MTPEQFILKWRDNKRKESAASKQHFLELCEVLEVPKPGDLGTPKNAYDFECIVTKSSGGKGYADVWKAGCFIWEYKGDRKSLTAAYSQIKDYAADLDNPPLLIVSDMSEIRIHTNFTNTPSVTHVIKLPDLISVEARRKLRYAFLRPEKLRPDETAESVTADAAATIGALATRLRAEGHDPRPVAHFLNKLVFCMFAQDIGLLPGYLFTEIMEESSKNSELFVPMISTLFAAMGHPNGLFGTTRIPWFNGGLFDDEEVLSLGHYELNDLLAAAQLDWSLVEPSIFGALFERGLDPAKRMEMASLFDARSGKIQVSATRDLFDSGSDKGIGIHYTDTEKIMRIIEPVVLRPLGLEWQDAKSRISNQLERSAQAKSETDRSRGLAEAHDIWLTFRWRLSEYRVLDPACGSGNFLYLALLHLKDFELLVQKEGRELGMPDVEQGITPDNLMGIEINPYAAELAQVTIWIGEIQWQLENGFTIDRVPILDSLPSIQCRDALLNPDGGETPWPVTDAIIGNPPFLGSKRLVSKLRAEYVERIFAAYKGRVPAAADLVCYWIVKAGEALRSDRAAHVGLVATNSIRSGISRQSVKSAIRDLVIYDAWASEPWVVDGAAVRVSMISFSKSGQVPGGTRHLGGKPVDLIYPNLRAGDHEADVDITRAKRLRENKNISFMGITKTGPFDVDGELARRWLRLPLNPNGRPNAEILRPTVNGRDLVGRARDRWIIDFTGMEERDACQFEAPFEYALRTVRPLREKNRQSRNRENWWQFERPRPAMWQSIGERSRYIGTSMVSKHRLFRWLESSVVPQNLVIVIARDDDTTMGILQSSFHRIWALRLGSSLEDRPRYTPSTVFETFPFPPGLTPDRPAHAYAKNPKAMAIADAMRELDMKRENWLLPSDMIERVPEIVEGYPDRVVPQSRRAGEELKQRFLTNLYNKFPTWLENAHNDLDQAVADAYGWRADVSEAETLAHLLALNEKRAAAEAE
jgi:type II restriction/modification system DNA methylase subunit YeeA